MSGGLNTIGNLLGKTNEDGHLLVSIAGGGVAGSTTEVQFNDAGAFAGDAAFTFDKTTDRLTLTGRVDLTNTTTNLFLGGRTLIGTSASGDLTLGDESGANNSTLFFDDKDAEITVTGATGTGAITGSGVGSKRNASGNGAASYIRLQMLDGSNRYLWVDATGDLRIHTAAPTEDGTTVSDTAGTVVGTQS